MVCIQLGNAGSDAAEVAVVDECGRVISSKALSGPAELRESAEHAARGWLFGPARLYEIPVKVVGTVTFTFQM